MPSPLTLLLLTLVGMGAGFVQRVSGFGLGIFAMLFLPHLTPTHTAASAISCLFSCGTSAYNAVRYRKQIPIGTVLPPLIAAMISIPVAVSLSKQITTQLFHALLGIVLILLGIYFLFFGKRIKLKANALSGVGAGLTGGVLNGLFSTGGPPIVLYLTHATADKDAYFAAIQFYFAVTNLYATAMRAINGLLTPAVLLSAAIGMIGCLIGDTVGRWVFGRIDGAMLKTIIYFGMMVSGIVLLI